jgi:transcriptional regulator GlxA family with amidase domain
MKHNERIASPYTVAEVAKMLNYSAQTITRLFENEKGVLIVERQAKKRNYISIRIPRAVYERVIRKLTVH